MKQNKSFLKILALSVTMTISMGMLTGCEKNEDTNNQEAGNTASVSIFDKISKVRDSSSAKISPIIETNLVKKHNAKEYLENGTKWDIEMVNNNQVVKDVALESLKNENYFMYLVSMGESFRHLPYADNKGVAVGFGYNLGMQSKQRNKDIYSMLTDNPDIIKSAQNLSGVMDIRQANTQDLNNIKLNPQQAAQVSMLMGLDFKEGIVPVIGDHAKVRNTQAKAFVKEKGMSSADFGNHLINSLDKAKAAAVNYHPYKVGVGGFSKYKNFMTDLVQYHFNPTEDNEYKVADGFTYKYTLNGQVKEDTRARALITTVWLTGENPKNLADFVKNNVKVNKNERMKKYLEAYVDESKPDGFKDELGDAIKEAEKQGKKINLAPVNNPESVAQKEMKKSLKFIAF